MPNPENTVQVAAQRADERYLDTYELDPETADLGAGGRWFKSCRPDQTTDFFALRETR
jgi:hypothetical protein